MFSMYRNIKLSSRDVLLNSIHFFSLLSDTKIAFSACAKSCNNQTTTFTKCQTHDTADNGISRENCERSASSF